MSLHFRSLGILHNKTCPHTIVTNEVVETRNRRIVERDFPMLIQSGMPLRYWVYAFRTIVYVMSILPTKALNFKISYQLLYNKILDFIFHRTFGSICFPYHNNHKLQSRSQYCVCFTARAFVL